MAFMKAALTTATTIVSLVIATPTFAWGKTGHRVTGEIADYYLSDDARLAIEEILGTESLAEASTWADEMRSNPSEFWQRTANPYHYVTVPAGKIYNDVGAPDEGDAVTALAQFAEILTDPNSTLAEKQLALRFTVHLIGDLHQPLHAGNGTDRGGNNFKVTWFGEESNLHRVWDSGIIDHEQLSYTEWSEWLLARVSDAESVMEPDPLTWISESAALRDTIYPEEQYLAWDYVYTHRESVRSRLTLGGIRMAAYFNDLFGEN